MKLFELQKDGTYKTTINNAMRYNLVLDFVSVGMSFRMAAKAVEHAKKRTHVSKLTGLNSYIVGQYIRVYVAHSPQQIGALLKDDSAWAFSLAFDGSTHRGQSFFDIRCRVMSGGKLFNLHMVALPLFERHTAENLFNTIVKFLDALYADWRSKLLSVATDGENTMTGHRSGVVTRLEQEAEHEVR